MQNNKYNNKWIVVDGIKFQSRDESLYYEHLKGLKARGEILNFTLQPKYELQPKFEKAGKKYRAITYSPDYLIDCLDGTEKAIDIKGFSTQQGELRRKLFDFKYPDVPLLWITRNLKHGDKYGWISYDDLQEIRKKNRKKKGSE